VLPRETVFISSLPTGGDGEGGWISRKTKNPLSGFFFSHKNQPVADGLVPGAVRAQKIKLLAVRRPVFVVLKHRSTAFSSDG
jgi:hypothetical protein